VFRGLRRERCVVIPNGWDPEDVTPSPTGNQTANSEDARAAISFVGNLGDHTLPGTFLSTVERVLDRDPHIRRNLRLRFVGRKSRTALNQLSTFRYPDVLEYVDEIAHSEAFAFMRRSAALLLLNEPSLARYLPGKLYDYLAAKRPIVVFGESGESADLVRGLHAGIVVPTCDAAALGAVLSKCIDGTLELPVDERLEEWLERHTRARLSQRIIEEIECLAGETHSRAGASCNFST
jgi:glycosyltransferase involved in cell wall biosynthesis